MTAIILTSCQQSKKLASSDEIGTYAFNVLTNLESLSENEYINRFYTFEELKSYVLAHPDEFGKEFLENYKVITKKDFNSRLIADYNKLQQEGTTFQIDWSEIEPVNYQYWPRATNGVQSMKGDLFFTHNKKAYKVTVTAFKAGTDFYVTKINDFSAVKEQAKK